METKEQASDTTTPEVQETPSASPGKTPLVNPYSPGVVKGKTPLTAKDSETGGFGGGSGAVTEELAYLRREVLELESRRPHGSATTAESSIKMSKGELAEMMGAAVVAAKAGDYKSEDTKHYLSTFLYKVQPVQRHHP